MSKINNLSQNKEMYLEKLKKHDAEAYEYFMRGIEILRHLNQNMFEAYIVGGTVRDILLGKKFKDIDISTTASPAEVMALFPHGDATYAELGCVTLREENMKFEITTFRIEEYSGKGRRPKAVHYSKRLTDDISRRDYTISALALTANCNVVDITKKGLKDLKHHKVRIIGKGDVRYQEDPIRIFRGLKLIAKYNFKPTFSTILSMKKSSKVLLTLTHSRLIEEIFNIFSEKYSNKAYYYMEQYEVFNAIPEYQEWLHQMLRSFKKLSNLEKFAMLFYKIGKIPVNTVFNKNEISEIQNITKSITILKNNDVDRMMIYQNSYESLISANCILVLLDNQYHDQSKLIKKLNRSAYIKNRGELNFKPEDLIKLMHGETGPRVGLIMNRITKMVVVGELNNNYNNIKKEAIKMLAMSDEELNENPSQDDSIKNDNPSSDSDTDRIERLRKSYLKDYKKTYDSILKTITQYDNMSVEEQRILEKEISDKAVKKVMDNNPKYLELFEKKGTKKDEEVQRDESRG